MDGAAMPAAAVASAAAAAATCLRMTAADEVLRQAAGTALALAEAFCGQWLIVREREEVVAGAPGWQRLTVVPVRAIVAPAGDQAVDITADGIGWVRSAASATVRYSAGVATTWDALPEPVAQGVVLLAVHLFEHREGEALPPAAVAALWRPYRRMRLNPEVRA